VAVADGGRQPAAERDRQQLQATAYAEHRQPSVGCLADERQLGPVARRVDLGGRGRVPAVQARVDVPSTGQHQRVDHVEQVERRPARHHHRQPARLQNGVDVRRGGPGHGELTPEPQHHVVGADDADDGLRHRWLTGRPEP
jgi:hypothetical protein